MKLKKITLVDPSNPSNQTVVANNVYAIMYNTGIYYVEPSSWIAYRQKKHIEDTDEKFFYHMSHDLIPGITILYGGIYSVTDVCFLPPK